MELLTRLKSAVCHDNRRVYSGGTNSCPKPATDNLSSATICERGRNPRNETKRNQANRACFFIALSLSNYKALTLPTATSISLIGVAAVMSRSGAFLLQTKIKPDIKQTNDMAGCLRLLFFSSSLPGNDGAEVAAAEDAAGRVWPLEELLGCLAKVVDDADGGLALNWIVNLVQVHGALVRQVVEHVQRFARLLALSTTDK